MFYVYMKLKALNNFNLDLRNIPTSGDFTLDLIDFPYSIVASVSGDAICLTTYERDLMRTNSHKIGSITWSTACSDLNNEIKETYQKNPGDLPTSLGILALGILSRIAAEEMLEQANATDEETQGVLFEVVDDKVNLKIVEGEERPSLACVNMGGMVVISRPYKNELTQSFVKEMMPPEMKEELAEEGDSSMMEQLYLDYLNGNGIVQDFEKAVYWAEKLAGTGSPDAMFNLGLHYAKGCGVERNFTKAAEWMEKAATAGDEDASTLITTFSEMEDLLPKSESGSAWAQARLAELYIQISGTLKQAGREKDYIEAFRLAKKASSQGMPKGDYVLALCYDYGYGTKKNPPEAAKLYERAASGGIAPAQYKLGCWYINGNTVEKDEKKGVDLLRKAADQKYAMAMRALGECYQFEHGVEYDMAKAVDWYEKSLEVSYDPELAQKVAVFNTLPEVQERKLSKSTKTIKPDYQKTVASPDKAFEQIQEHAKEIRSIYRKYNSDWQPTAIKFQSKAALIKYNSANEITTEMNKMVKDRNQYGKKYDDLIIQIDNYGEEALLNGGDYRSVGLVYDLINEVIKATGCLTLDFGTVGASPMNLKSTDFSLSDRSTSIKKKWENRYQNTPEGKAAIQKQRTKDRISEVKNEIAELKGKQTQQTKLKSQLEKQVMTMKNNISKAETNLENDEQGIRDNADIKIAELEKNIKEFTEEKSRLQKELDDSNYELSRLSFFRSSRKKDLTATITGDKVLLQLYEEKIGAEKRKKENVEKERDESIETLKTQISDDRTSLNNLERKLADVDSEIKRLESNIGTKAKTLDGLEATYKTM